jgi:PD-(D/E)XK nuclease superfamily
MKSFENWKAEELELTYGLQELKKHPFLETWLSHHVLPSDYENQALNNLQKVLQDNADSWNEDEVKFFFIGPLVALINFMTDYFKAFTQRPLSAKIMDVDGNETQLSGKVDMMVANGKEDPRQPFFFVHEYKQEKRRETDPKGQLLATMLAAQKNNKGKEFPILGSYVIGRLWFFVVLDGNNYARSLAFDASREGIYDIFSFLHFAKNNIEINAKQFVNLRPNKK